MLPLRKAFARLTAQTRPGSIVCRDIPEKLWLSTHACAAVDTVDQTNDALATTTDTNPTTLDDASNLHRHKTQRRYRKWSKQEVERLQEAVESYPHPRIDWKHIAVVVGRCAVSCRLKWENSISPSVTRGPWTPEETQRLVELIRTHGFGNWKTIKPLLSTNRTTVQCIMHYKLLLTNRGPWTSDEEDKLMAIVAECGTSDWHEIANRLGSRTPHQCRQKYERSLQDGGMRGRWSKEEIAKLVKLVGEYGDRAHWSEIAERLGTGRTNVQCMNKYQWHSRSRDPLSDDELKRLLEGVYEHGTGNWVAVARHVGSRSNLECFYAFRRFLRLSDK